MVKLEKKSPKAAAPKAKGQAKKGKAKPVKVVEEEESDSSEEEEEEMEVQTTKAQPAKAVAVADDDSDEDSDEDEEDDDEDESDDDEEDEDDSEEEEEVKGQNGKAAAKQAEEEDSDDDDEDEEESSEEESDEDEEETPAPQATKRKAETKAAVPAKKAKAEEEDEDDSDEDEDDDDEDEEEDSDEEDEEEDSDDEEDEEEEEEEEETPQAGKRKAKAAVEEESPAKKAKVEGEQSTLFVGNLTEKVTEEKLRKFFKKKGLEVLDLRYLTKSSGVSLAYVDVPAAEEATALELNGATLAGTELKVEKAKSKKQEPKSPGQNFGNDNDRDARTLFLKNLSYDSTKESVMEVFTDAVDVRIPVFKDSGRPKGIAFVEFESEAKVEEVKSSMDGVEVDGRRVGMDYVGSKAQFTGKSPQGKSPGGGFNAPATPSKTLVVKNLSYNTTSEGLQEAFEGSTGARVIMKPGTDRSRGFGYVDFESEEAAKEAMDNMNQSELDGRTINVEFGMARGSGGGGGGGFNSPAQVSKTLIVKNLSYDTGEDDLQQAFEGCTSARVITDRESGRSKGFGYIDFDSEDAAQEALKSMDEQEVGGRRIRLDFALPRGEGGGRGTEMG
ncbi:PREDICTED: nucleolin-like isoform X5 [Branchiostoma belcheri]|uniref:Nucleolin-like isoform X4 n=1 Tax=Branchiostoma belcheri TaxID=7741 RepID=A0A6P5AY82_BRABE|nr:PREDICTED: nucleolin-like isoform X4 [Branchiostoma belcheri]XP_019647067.1 PREDICTED: nucleolin-like isoform X5 [Branchiostoma belcheri]